MKYESILDRLRREGKVIVLSDEEQTAIKEHMSKAMAGFKADLRRKERQSERDLHAIILNA